MNAGPDRVLATLARGDMELNDLAAVTNISLARARHWLRSLEEKGLVEEDEAGIYGLTAKGDAVVVERDLDEDEDDFEIDTNPIPG